MLFHFFITFYANRSDATRKSKSVFDVSSEWDFLRQSKHISGMFDNEKVKGGWCGEGIVYADASLYQKFASVGGYEKGDDDMAASGKLTQDEIGFDACRRMSNFHRDIAT